MKRSAVLLMCLALAFLCLLPAAAPVQGEPRVVRVGWYETPFNRKDSFGRRTGYAYEYQRKIAAYTGWKYEYVEGTWPELLQMAEDGRIDLLSDVSYTPERTQYLLYANIPMGEELYYLYVAEGSTDISAEDYSTLNGKKVGVTRNSVQTDFFLDWAEKHGVTVDLVLQDGSEHESLEKLKKGELDAFVTLDTYGDPGAIVPLWKIGSSDFFFAVSKKQPDLLPELDAAMNRIQDENKFYSEQLSEKYFKSTGTNYFLTAEENAWLKDHGKIRVGYQDNYLAFCAADPKTGELTGALKDYLDYAAGTLENAKPEFEPVAFPTAAAALEALTAGEVDCMFPANLTDYDGELMGVVMTAPLMRTAMDAVVRQEDRQDFLRKSLVRVAVNQGNPNYEMFLVEHFPSWTPVRYENTQVCLDQVAMRNADCIIISNYRYRDISARCERLNLTTVYTGVDMDYCFAVREGNTVLYSILSKLIGQVPDATVNAALAYYSSASAPSGVAGFFRRNPVAILIPIATAFVLFLLAYLALRGRKKPGEKTPREK